MNDKIPTQGEWNVLSCLWERAPMTAMELAAALEEKVGWAKSTTLTTLRRMEEGWSPPGPWAGPGTIPRRWSGRPPSGGRPAPFWTRCTGAAWA